jgi:hypothetical protein
VPAAIISQRAVAIRLARWQSMAKRAAKAGPSETIPDLDIRSDVFSREFAIIPLRIHRIQAGRGFSSA